ncbi:Hypp3308 [Branchiostoma lanceolatum]|uniref:Hypp3308 protein n=1 Tax=Branchiostoma lanceolatum TaxID=7740 RepID=A0A8J9ZZ02_BRALA|nr:Hypp3308 [Branchiostoma lanceolatum]
MDDSSTQCEDDFEKETGESASKPAAVDSKAPETVVVNKASPDDGVSSPTVVEGDVPDTTGGKSNGVDEADSAAILDELIEDEVEPEVSLRDSGIGLDPQPPSPTSDEPKSQVAEAEGSGIVENKPTPAEQAPLDSQPDSSTEKPNASNDDTKPPTSDTTEDPSSNKESPTHPDLQSENDGLKQQLKSLRGEYEEKVGILELQLDEEKEKVEEQARRIKELQKLLRKQQDDDMASHGSGDIKEKAKAAASLRLERDFLVRQYSEGKTTEECLRQTITDMLEEKEKDEQKIKDLDARVKRAAKDHEAKDKRMDQLQAELRDVTALVTQLEEHMDKVKVEEARRNIQAAKARTETEPPVTNNNKSSVCTIF